MTVPPSLRLRAELAVVLVSFIWGSTFLVVKMALDDVSPILFLLIRFGLAFLLLMVLFRGRFSNPGPLRLVWTGGCAAGLLLFAGYALQTVGLRYTSVSKSAFLTGLYIVLIPLLSSFVKRSGPSWMEWLGIGLATGGTALLTSGGVQSEFNRGDALTIGCAVAFAAHIVVVAHYSRLVNYEVLSVLQIGGVALFSLLTFGWLETPYITWGPRLIFAVSLTAVFATAISFALYTWAQAHTSATRAALFFSTEPVFAGLTAWALAGESWTFRSVAGAALILTGILSAELKPVPAQRHLSP
ncbi:MAG: DMT family transporter [Bryobacterales bacterium]|nr:DMT family transporter [Bryobacterales bacterium]